MRMKSYPSKRSQECPKRRLAESAVAAVDLCECGTYQLHVGALTVRLTTDAFAELQHTLAHALEQAAVPRARTHAEWSLRLNGLRPRGSA